MVQQLICCPNSEKIELKVRYIVLQCLSLSFIDTLRLASNVEAFINPLLLTVEKCP